MIGYLTLFLEVDLSVHAAEIWFVKYIKLVSERLSFYLVQLYFESFNLLYAYLFIV